MDTPIDAVLRLVADANIPHAAEAFGPFGRVRRVPGREITREVAREADVLLVRSVTTVDAALVEGTPVRFVGTATAGTDHVDAAALAALGVAFASAPGSNAASVADYVLAALLAVAVEKGEGLEGRTLGVVGVGEVGGRLVPRARALGLRVLACDPPRADAGFSDHDYRALPDVLRLSDVVSLHTPLTIGGRWPTAGLVGADALDAMRPGAWLVNAARGRVLDGDALRQRAGHLGALVFDVWPSEPSPDPALVALATLATPHVAGYASDAKTRGTAVVADALRQWAATQGIDAAVPALGDRDGVAVDVPDLPSGTSAERAAWLDALVRQAYSVRADDGRFRAALAGVEPDAERARRFAALRRDYLERRELSRAAVRGVVPAALAEAVGGGLGMRAAG